MRASAVLVAGGKGERLGGPVPKQFQQVAGRMLIEYSLSVLSSTPSVVSIVIVVPPLLPRNIVDTLFSYRKVSAVVPGGKRRIDSVILGLKSLRGEGDVILVHDAARPLLDRDFVEKLVREAKEQGSAVPSLPVSDSLKLSDDGRSVGSSLSRGSYYYTQTPQAFRREVIMDSAGKAEEADWACTDEAEMVEMAGYPVFLVPGQRNNVKVTHHEDLAYVRSTLGAYTGDFKVGLGYDAHQLVEGRELYLGGVKVECEKGLLGHSDGDCALHAIVDALLGASSLGDIGGHFPPDDEELRGISSVVILEEIREKIHRAGYRVVNVDCVIICQKPRISDYAGEMAQSISRSLSIEEEAVSVKGKSTEGMGFEGSGEGISSMAVVLLEKVKGEMADGA